MATEIKSQSEIQEEYLAEFGSRTTKVNDQRAGSLLDILSGVTSVAVREIMTRTVQEFRKTWFSTAHGPEITGGPDDLQNLAVDHFGSVVARRAATKASGVVTFSRANADAGNCIIPAGTVVYTDINANGESQRFVTLLEVTLTGTTINASVEAVEAGVDGNALAETVTKIESTLTDPSVVVENALAFTGGAAVQSDEEYREFLGNYVAAIRGAVISALESMALTVSGVEQAKILEQIKAVKEWDIANDEAIGEYFYICYVALYIADANGTASQALIDAVKAAIAEVRACGVRVQVLAAETVEIDWTAVIELDADGPNFATLQSDPQMILDTMEKYISDLAVGADFNVTAANAAMLAIWGPSGTGDITSFSTTVPVGNVILDATEKAIAGDLEI